MIRAMIPADIYPGCKSRQRPWDSPIGCGWFRQRAMTHLRNHQGVVERGYAAFLDAHDQSASKCGMQQALTVLDITLHSVGQTVRS